MGEDHSHRGLYLALGALAAVGAGYLMWKYVLTDEQKEKTSQAVGKVAAKAKTQATQAVSAVRGRIHHAGDGQMDQ